MTVHLLGTGAATSDPHRTTTMLAFEEGDTSFLVDCGGDAVQRMLMAGLDPVSIDAVILTHEHPDHIGGFALLMEKLWLLGRRTPVPIYGPKPTLELARAIFDLYNTQQWEGLPEREWHSIDMTEGALVFKNGPFQVTAAPVDHPVPTIGLRIETTSSTVAYSCDTSPCDAVVTLARDADLLIHEGTGALPGVHSSPEEAAEAAAESDAARLILVHIPAGASDDDLGKARAIFAKTEWATEGGSLTVERNEPHT